jgi:glycosyltransferase involved in cell wall biosynthesis
MKVALVHDWLTGMRGGERCLEAFLSIYPDADIHTLIHVPGSTSALIDERVRGTSWLQMLPKAGTIHRLLLPLYPSAARSLRLSGYDLVISLSHAAAKNVAVPEGTRHICYCFTPMRYIWDQSDQYFGPARLGLWPIIKGLRSWDVRGAAGVTDFVAISRFIAARIRCYYQRSSSIVYPPVNTSWIAPAEEGSCGEAFLYAGALVPYKRPDLIVEAANRLKLPLWVVGGGPMEAALRKQAGPTVVVRGRCSDEELAEYYRRCRALILPGVEDFGMMPVECMAAGRPVIGRRFGGTADTIQVDEGRSTGLLIRGNRHSLTVDDIAESLTRFMLIEERFSVKACREQAARFSPEVFLQSWSSVAEGSS